MQKSSYNKTVQGRVCCADNQANWQGKGGGGAGGSAPPQLLDLWKYKLGSKATDDKKGLGMMLVLHCTKSRHRLAILMKVMLAVFKEDPKK